MKAADIMTTEVVSAGPETDVSEVARLLLAHRISAAPVVDDDGRVIGMVSEADLMRRVLPPTELAAWLGAFMPRLPLDGSTSWLQPAVVTDPSDGKLAHLDGLNLSRAWMLEGIAAGLPSGDPRVATLRGTAAVHRSSGLAAVTGAHYEGGHWLGSFAVYLVTGRGLPGSPGR